MLVARMMRSKNAISLYDNDGNHSALTDEHYRIGDIIAALDVLIKTGEPVEIDVSRFSIVKALNHIMPAAKVEPLPDDAVRIIYEDLDLTISRPERLERHIRDASRTPAAAQALRKFLMRCASCSRAHAVDELLDFMAKNAMSISSDGCVMALKYVAANPNQNVTSHRNHGIEFLDCRTMTIDNSVGTYVRMNPDQVNPDRTKPCEAGLHVGARAYVQHYGSGKPVLIVKCHPAHFLAVPHEDSYTKARTCAYLVLGVENDIGPEQMERLKTFPLAPAHDGRTLVATGPITAEHQGLFDLIRRRNPDCFGRPGEPIFSTHYQDTPPARTAVPNVATETEEEWYSYKALAAITGKTAATLRGIAAREDWPRRVVSGTTHTQPSATFAAREIHCWIDADDLAKARGKSAKAVLAAAAKTKTATRRLTDGTWQIRT